MAWLPLTIDEQFAKLSLEEMPNVIARLQGLYDRKLYLSRNYVIMDTFADTTHTEYACVLMLVDCVKKFKSFIGFQRTTYRKLRMETFVSRRVIIPCNLTYRNPTRGNLELLGSKYTVNMSEYQRGFVWIQLRGIITSWYRTTFPDRPLQLEYRELSVRKIDRAANKYYHELVPAGYGFATSNTQFSMFLITLSQVCKTWRVVLKSMCIWWGSAGSEFAFVKGSIDSPSRINSPKHIQKKY